MTLHERPHETDSDKATLLAQYDATITQLDSMIAAIPGLDLGAAPGVGPLKTGLVNLTTTVKRLAIVTKKHIAGELG